MFLICQDQHKFLTLLAECSDTAELTFMARIYWGDTKEYTKKPSEKSWYRGKCARNKTVSITSCKV